MNHSREKGKNKKPIKSRREGYTGERKKKNLEYLRRKKKDNKPKRVIRLFISDEEFDEIRKRTLQLIGRGK